MSKAYSLINTSISEKKNRQRIAKRKNDPAFRSQIQSIRQRMAGGQALSDIRAEMQIKSNSLWEDMKTALKESLANPEHVWIECQDRQMFIYKAAASLYQDGKESGDFSKKAQGLFAIMKAQDAMVEMAKYLGLIKPMVDPKTQGEGYSEEEIDRARQRFDELLQERILAKLEAEREPESIESIPLLIGSESGGETDTVEVAPLAQNDSTGPKP